MARDPREARTLGLWTAAWLAVLLLGGLLWLGDLSLQWPVLLVPLLWALVAVRPRRHRREEPHPADGAWDGVVRPQRTDTVERPALRPRQDPPR
jgi:hypothetical protein